MRRSLSATIILLSSLKLALSGAGCALSQEPVAPPTTPTTNPANLLTTQPYYWTTQPAVVQVTSASFHRLWNASATVAREYGYKLDRQDLRTGLLTTEPLISQQFFEIWARDTGDAAGVADNSITTYRRTIRFEIQKDNGQFTLSPRVLIERSAQAEQPITSAVGVRSSMATQRHPTLGTKETDRGVYMPSNYWYATGRDYALERKLAKSITKKLNS